MTTNAQTDTTLLAYYQKHYRPKLSAYSRSECDPAVKLMHSWRGGKLIPGDVTPRLLKSYSRWLKKCGKSKGRITRYLWSIRRIVHSWDPTRFVRTAHNKMELQLPAEPGTLRHFFDTVHLPQRMIDAKPNSVRQTRRAMLRLSDHYQRDIKLDELNDALAAEHFAWLRDERHLRATSINNGHRATLFAVWRYAYELKLLPELPRVRKFRELHDEPDSWDTDELARLLQATQSTAGRRNARWKGVVPMVDWWRAFLLVGYWTGLRAGSILKIELQHVNLETGMLYTTPASSKTRSGKSFRLGADAIEAIRKISKPDRTLLFEWPWGRRTLWDHFAKIQKAAGLPTNGRSASRLHKLRRSVATQVAVAGGMAAAIALLDHSGPQITKRYIDPSRMPGMDATAFLPTLEKL